MVFALLLKVSLSSKTTEINFTKYEQVSTEFKNADVNDSFINLKGFQNIFSLKFSMKTF